MSRRSEYYRCCSHWVKDAHFFFNLYCQNLPFDGALIAKQKTHYGSKKPIVEIKHFRILFISHSIDPCIASVYNKLNQSPSAGHFIRVQWSSDRYIWAKRCKVKGRKETSLLDGDLPSCLSQPPSTTMTELTSPCGSIKQAHRSRRGCGGGAEFLNWYQSSKYIKNRTEWWMQKQNRTAGHKNIILSMQQNWSLWTPSEKGQ